MLSTGYASFAHRYQASHPRPTISISPRCVRCCKNIAIIIGTMLVIIFYSSLISYSDSVHRNSRRRPPEKLAQAVERLGLCSHWSEHYPNQSMNVSVKAICDQLNATHINYYRLQTVKVNPFLQQFLLAGAHICDSSTEVVILVHSLHAYTDRRTAIRRTWAGATVSNTWPSGGVGATVAVAFVLGQNKNQTQNKLLLEENNKHHDIIQGDFFESYRNMTLKSLLGFKWVLEYCPSVRHLIKSDDDMFINVPALVRVVGQHNMTRAIMGPLNRGSRVYRSGKWKLTQEQFPFYYFPQYESGAAYVINIDLIAPLYQAAEYVRHIFIDDVFITGILGEILQVRHIDQVGFAYWTNKKPTACDVKTNSILTGHRVTPDSMVGIWKELLRDPKCKVDTRKVLV